MSIAVSVDWIICMRLARPKEWDIEMLKDIVSVCVCGERTAFKLCDSNYLDNRQDIHSKYWAPINIIYYVKRASWTHNRICWQMAGYICRELSLGLCIGWFDGGEEDMRASWQPGMFLRTYIYGC